MHEKKLNTLYDICEALTKELEEVAEKTRGGMSAGDLDLIDKLTHALKSTKATIAMIEADMEDEGGYSGWFPRYYYAQGGGSSRAYEGGGSSRAYEGGSSNRGSYAQGYSSRRGRGRDSMGRFTRGRSYAYDDGGEQAMEQIRGMLDQLPDDKRREIEQALDRV